MTDMTWIEPHSCTSRHPAALRCRFAPSLAFRVSFETAWVLRGEFLGFFGELILWNIARIVFSLLLPPTDDALHPFAPLPRYALIV